MRLFPFVTAPLCLFLAGCATWIDEMKIRADDNTIVNPDIWEMQELENREGVPSSSAGGTPVAGSALPPNPEGGPGVEGGAGTVGPEIPEAVHRATQPTVIPRTVSNTGTPGTPVSPATPVAPRPEQPLPDTAKDLGTVPVDKIPGLSGERPELSPNLLRELQN